MDQQYFGVSLEKLLTSGGQTLYMVAWSLIIGTIIGIILCFVARADLQRIGFSTIS